MKKLSRTEMKSVNGGKMAAAGKCTFTFTDGTTWTGGNGDQCAADFICTGDDKCVDVDCPGSDC